jgi:hypothetical protein
MSSDPHAEELVRSQPENIAERGIHFLQRSIDASTKDGIPRAESAERAVGEFRGEGRIPAGKAVAAKRRR